MQSKLPEQTATDICTFIQQTFQQQAIKHAVIAVSGGIDSALSLTLLTKALGASAITPVLLPYGDQDISDAETLCRFNQFQSSDWVVIDIQSIVDQICALRVIPPSDHVRRGNIMARVRMILIFDLAREHSALVCGTENKSEHYLGYFTRFGDAASDIEPICQLYKTQVRELAAQLQLPQQILTKAPSAGLWDDQTDENELGFSYADADQVLVELIDKKIPSTEIRLPTVSPIVVQAVCERVAQQSFKRAVPYTME